MRGGIVHILVATTLTNGDFPGDYDWCVDGELVYLQEPCARDLRDPDGGCGCGRGFSGTSSHRATTTALVVSTELTEGEVRLALRASLEEGGWLPPDCLTAEEQEAIVDDYLTYLRGVADYFPAGSIVRRQLHKYYTGAYIA